MWFVYILRCADKTLYTGVTTDLKRRLKQHNDGVASRYTRARLPVKLIYKEKAESRAVAQKREFEIKKMPKSKKAELALQKYLF